MQLPQMLLSQEGSRPLTVPGDCIHACLKRSATAGMSQSGMMIMSSSITSRRLAEPPL